MVQIDDAGSGSLVGGTCIGAMRVETKEYVYDFVPVNLYQNGNFHSKKYLEKSRDIVFELLKKMKPSKEEEILICQGYMFDIARKDLKKQGYNFRNAKIVEPL